MPFIGNEKISSSSSAASLPQSERPGGIAQQQHQQQNLRQNPISQQKRFQKRQNQHQQISRASPASVSRSSSKQPSILQQQQQQKMYSATVSLAESGSGSGSNGNSSEETSPISVATSGLPMGYDTSKVPQTPQPPQPGNAIGFAVVSAAPIIAPGIPTPAYTFYTGGSPPLGSPQLPQQHIGSPALAAAQFITHVPMNAQVIGGRSQTDQQHYYGPHTVHSPVGSFAGGSKGDSGASNPQYRSSTIDPSHDTQALVTDVVDSKNIYIRNLPEDCTDEVLVQLAQSYGDIVSSKSIIEESTGKCKGYGFVKYRTDEQAERAIEGFTTKGFESTHARDSFKTKLKRLQDKTSANVYISSLPPNIDEDALVELIKPYTVISARILRDATTGMHRGAGFARMPDRETAMKVIEKLKGIQLVGSPLPLSPRIADSDEQKILKKHQQQGQPQSLYQNQHQPQMHLQQNGSTSPPLGTAPTAVAIRSGAVSPIMLSPMLVYSPAGSPIAHHHLQAFDTTISNGGIPIPGAAQVPVTSTINNDNNSNINHNSRTYSQGIGASVVQGSTVAHSPPMHTYTAQYMSGGGFSQPNYNSATGPYTIPASPIPYQSYISPSGYVSPTGYTSNPGYISPVGYIPPSGYASPSGYMSPSGYASPPPQSSPQIGYSSVNTGQYQQNSNIMQTQVHSGYTSEPDRYFVGGYQQQQIHHQYPDASTPAHSKSNVGTVVSTHTQQASSSSTTPRRGNNGSSHERDHQELTNAMQNKLNIA